MYNTSNTPTTLATLIAQVSAINKAHQVHQTHPYYKKHASLHETPSQRDTRLYGSNPHPHSPTSSHPEHTQQVHNNTPDTFITPPKHTPGTPRPNEVFLLTDNARSTYVIAQATRTSIVIPQQEPCIDTIPDAPNTPTHHTNTTPVRVPITIHLKVSPSTLTRTTDLPEDMLRALISYGVSTYVLPEF